MATSNSSSGSVGANAASVASATDAGASIAKDLGAQYEQFHRFEVTEVLAPHPDARGVGGLFAVVPKGKQLVSVKEYIDEYRTKPERREGTATFFDQASFAAHANRFKNPDSAIFASPDRAQPKLVAVLDYHPAGADPQDAAFGAHRSVFACRLSDPWKAWAAVDGKPLDQVTFAAFLEDRISDVVVAPDTPDMQDFAALVAGSFATPNKLIELSRGLAINVDVQVRDARTLSTGEVDIKYVEQHRDGEGQPLKVPNLFVIAIPVFYGGPSYAVPVRLRYRLANGRITWSTSLVRPDRVFDDAFAEICTTIAQATELPVFQGTPEA